MYCFRDGYCSIDGQESKGPYGYLCLGLSYCRNHDDGPLELDNMILACVDIGLRKTIEPGLYCDMFEHPMDEITEKDGRYYYDACPILNSEMLKIPKQLDSAEKMVNRVCGARRTSVCKSYTELYACVLDFDETTLRGSLVGFDCLGKILRRPFDLNGKSSRDDIREELLKDMVLFDLECGAEHAKRKNECGLLNLDFTVNDNNEVSYEYTSIW